MSTRIIATIAFMFFSSRVQACIHILGCSAYVLSVHALGQATPLNWVEIYSNILLKPYAI